MFASLGLVTVMRIPILAFGLLSWNQLYNSLYVLPFFYITILGKKCI
jgi:hypothetical protein